MPLELDSLTETDTTSNESATETVIHLPIETGTARLTLPGTADKDEVAALVAAVSTRLNDADTDTESERDTTNIWRLAGRFGARRRYELPRDCRRGREWKAAGRCP